MHLLLIDSSLLLVHLGLHSHDLVYNCCSRLRSRNLSSCDSNVSRVIGGNISRCRYCHDGDGDDGGDGGGDGDDNYNDNYNDDDDGDDDDD